MAENSAFETKTSESNRPSESVISYFCSVFACELEMPACKNAHKSSVVAARWISVQSDFLTSEGRRGEQ